MPRHSPFPTRSGYAKTPGQAAQAALVAALVIASLCWARASGTVTNCTETNLRAALVGGGSVVIACDSAIALTGTIVVAKDTVIDGTGHTTGLAGSDSTNSVRLFLVQPGASLILRHLTLSNGKLVGADGTNSNHGEPAYGAAIFNDHGLVILDGCTLTDHSATGGAGAAGAALGFDGGSGGQAAGAAVYNFGGQLTITNSTFSANTALGGAGGAGAAAAIGGNGNDGGRGGDGGAGSGAAIYNADQGLVSILSTSFSDNSVTGSPGGKGGSGSGLVGIAGRNGNAGGALGAAVVNASGSIAIVNSSFVGNAGLAGSGGAGQAAANAVQGLSGSDGGSALGAGVYSQVGQVTLTNCTFARNALTGGRGGAGGAGNGVGLGTDGGRGGDGGSALGAGVCTSAKASTLIVNCTFSDNTVTGGASGTGGVGGGVGSDGDDGKAGSALGGALFSQGGAVALRNSILAFSLSAANAGGPVTDQGFNLSSDATPAFHAPGSRNRIDARLGSLTLVSSVASTLTLSSNSPAINAIAAADDNGAPFYDQRNAFRVRPFDIGAYEFGASTARPILQATRRNGQVLLSWPAGGSLVLQTSTLVSGSNRWTTVTNIPSTSADGLNSLPVALINSSAFFRLGK